MDLNVAYEEIFSSELSHGWLIRVLLNNVNYHRINQVNFSYGDILPNALNSRKDTMA